MVKVTKKKDAKSKKRSSRLGVVCLQQIPHGFYEKEMQSYFSQFGRVKRIRVARSRKTLNSKGYAYIEFQNEEVAKVVADTMNNYLMFDKLMKSRFIPAGKVHPETFFRPQNPTKLHSTRKRALKDIQSKQTDAQHAKLVKKIEKRLNKTKLALKELGINFKFDLPEVAKVQS